MSLIDKLKSLYEPKKPKPKRKSIAEIKREVDVEMDALYPAPVKKNSGGLLSTMTYVSSMTYVGPDNLISGSVTEEFYLTEDDFSESPRGDQHETYGAPPPWEDDVIVESNDWMDDD